MLPSHCATHIERAVCDVLTHLAFAPVGIAGSERFFVVVVVCGAAVANVVLLFLVFVFLNRSALASVGEDFLAGGLAALSSRSTISAGNSSVSMSPLKLLRWFSMSMGRNLASIRFRSIASLSITSSMFI